MKKRSSSDKGWYMSGSQLNAHIAECLGTQERSVEKLYLKDRNGEPKQHRGQPKVSNNRQKYMGYMTRRISNQFQDIL